MVRQLLSNTNEMLQYILALQNLDLTTAGVGLLEDTVWRREETKIPRIFAHPFTLDSFGRVVPVLLLASLSSVRRRRRRRRLARTADSVSAQIEPPPSQIGF
jgi:hypothetical protein